MMVLSSVFAKASEDSDLHSQSLDSPLPVHGPCLRALRALESEVLFGFLVDQVPLHLNMKHIPEAEILEVLKCEQS